MYDESSSASSPPRMSRMKPCSIVSVTGVCT